MWLVGVSGYRQIGGLFQICGIGKVTEKMLNALDITNCQHLYDKRNILSLLFSQASSNFFLGVSLGLGSIEVQRSVRRSKNCACMWYFALYVDLAIRKASARKGISVINII